MDGYARFEMDVRGYTWRHRCELVGFAAINFLYYRGYYLLNVGDINLGQCSRKCDEGGVLFIRG